MSKDTVIGHKHHAGGLDVGATRKRSILRIDGDGTASLDPDAQVRQREDGGHVVTAPWLDGARVGDCDERRPFQWISQPGGRLAMGNLGISVDTNVMIQALLAAPDRTVDLADLPQVDG